jgi:hypothetical protein
MSATTDDFMPTAAGFSSNELHRATSPQSVIISKK